MFHNRGSTQIVTTQSITRCRIQNQLKKIVRFLNFVDVLLFLSPVEKQYRFKLNLRSVILTSNVIS